MNSQQKPNRSSKVAGVYYKGCGDLHECAWQKWRMPIWAVISSIWKCTRSHIQLWPNWHLVNGSCSHPNVRGSYHWDLYDHRKVIKSRILFLMNKGSYTIKPMLKEYEGLCELEEALDWMKRYHEKGETSDKHYWFNKKYFHIYVANAPAGSQLRTLFDQFTQLLLADQELDNDTFFAFFESIEQLIEQFKQAFENRLREHEIAYFHSENSCD